VPRRSRSIPALLQPTLYMPMIYCLILGSPYRSRTASLQLTLFPLGFCWIEESDSAYERKWWPDEEINRAHDVGGFHKSKGNRRQGTGVHRVRAPPISGRLGWQWASPPAKYLQIWEGFIIHAHLPSYGIGVHGNTLVTASEFPSQGDRPHLRLRGLPPPQPYSYTGASGKPGLVRCNPPKGQDAWRTTQPTCQSHASRCKLSHHHAQGGYSSNLTRSTRHEAQDQPPLTSRRQIIAPKPTRQNG
jgi:hypothetical protein